MSPGVDGNPRVGGGPRVHQTAEASVAFRWTCPACGTENVNPFAEGCLACGSGTAKQAEMAMGARREAAIITVASLTLAVLAPEFAQYALKEWLTPLTEKARQTVLTALEFYLAQGQPVRPAQELTTEELRAWRLALEPEDVPETTT